MQQTDVYPYLRYPWKTARNHRVVHAYRLSLQDRQEEEECKEGGQEGEENSQEVSGLWSFRKEGRDQSSSVGQKDDHPEVVGGQERTQLVCHPPRTGRPLTYGERHVVTDSG